MGEAADRLEAEVPRQPERLVAAEGGDVSLLPLDVAPVVGVILQRLDDRGIQRCQRGPERREVVEGHVGIADQLAGGAPAPVPVRRDTVAAQYIRRGIERVKQALGLGQRRALGGEALRALSTDVARLDSAPGEPPVRIIGPEPQAIFGA